MLPLQNIKPQRCLKMAYLRPRDIFIEKQSLHFFDPLISNLRQHSPLLFTLQFDLAMLNSILFVTNGVVNQFVDTGSIGSIAPVRS